MRLVPFLPFASLALLGACGETITVSDDIDLTWDFAVTPLDRFDSDLHVPYVRGTEATLRVSSDDDDRRFDGWTLESSDEGVLRIGETSVSTYNMSARGQAVGEGLALVTVRDRGGEVVGRAEVEVLTPDRIVLEAHGYLIQDRPEDAEIDDARIIADGTATYHVRYFRGGTELHGNGVLSAVTPAGITAEPRTSFLFEDREWLTLHTTAPGTYAIELAADGATVEARTIEVVPASAVADVVILSESERKAEDGEWLVLLAQAYDNMGRRIFGIAYDWEVDGARQTEAGDLYRYEFKEGARRSVKASTAGHSDSVTIQSENGYVDSSNEIGCQAGGATGGGAGLVAALGMLGRRRRRRTVA